MHRLRWGRCAVAAIAAIGALGASGCASSDITLSSGYMPRYGMSSSSLAADELTGPETSCDSASCADPKIGTPEHGPGSPAMGASGCSFSVAGISDRRQDPHNLGYIGMTLIHADDFPSWIGKGLGSLPGYSDKPAGVSMKVEILKAYIESVSTAKTANIVLRVQFQPAGAPPQEKIFRGVDSSMNWASGAGEAQSALDRALNQLLNQINVALYSMCGTQGS